MKDTWDRLTMVVAIDFSPASLAAARWAVKSFRTRQLVLAHSLVIPEMRGVLAERYPIPKNLLINARTGARRRLQDVQRSLGVDDAILDVREGRPAEAIAQVARAYDADLILVGKHGEGGSMRGYAGNTADQLVRSAPASVIVANGMLNQVPRQILVPVTYSSITPHVIDWVKKLHAHCDAKIIALHVVGSAVLSHVLSMSRIRDGAAPTTAEVDEIFGEDRDRWTAEFIKAGIRADHIRTEVVFGEVSESILTAVSLHDVDMIVMGSHAGPLRRLLLGSAASAVLRNATIPVFIITEPEEGSVDTLGKPSDSARELETVW